MIKLIFESNNYDEVSKVMKEYYDSSFLMMECPDLSKDIAAYSFKSIGNRKKMLKIVDSLKEKGINLEVIEDI